MDCHSSSEVFVGTLLPCASPPLHPCIYVWKCSHLLTGTALWICIILDNEDRKKKITIAIKPPVAQNLKDSTDNVTDIRSVVQGLRLSPPLQVSAFYKVWHANNRKPFQLGIACEKIV